MLDIKYIQENAEKIKEAAINKNIELDVDKLLNLAEERSELQVKIDNLRSKRNEVAAQSKNGKPAPAQIEEGKKIKEELVQLDQRFKVINEEYYDCMVKVPTIPSTDTPVGKDESGNIEVEKWGEPTKFDFKPKNHIELAESLDLIDFERGAKVAGYRGYYVKNEAVLIQLGLMMYALEKLISKGFTPMIPPTLLKEFALFGSGYFSSRTYNPDVDEIYKIDSEEVEADGKPNKENKFLVGTAEPSLLAYYSGEILEEKNLPIKICGFSQCYRSEIGSYGKDTKGIYRVHEFMKVEQIAIMPADIDMSDQIHQDMLAISKEMHQELNLPYRVLQICTGDMSPGKYKMFDLEAWIPSRNDYGETGSASNFLDWQSRRLNVKYKDKTGKNQYVYMLNNTAIPSPRFLIAILENYQQADGSIAIPKVLQKYIPGKDKICLKK